MDKFEEFEGSIKQYDYNIISIERVQEGEIELMLQNRDDIESLSKDKDIQNMPNYTDLMEKLEESDKKLKKLYQEDAELAQYVYVSIGEEYVNNKGWWWHPEDVNPLVIRERKIETLDKITKLLKERE